MVKISCASMKINNSKFAVGIAIIAILIFLLCTGLVSYAQTGITAFGPSDKFIVPEYNGTINFAVSGTYSSAILENNIWTFTNLDLKGSQTLKNLEFSTQNSNVTILSYITSNTTGIPTVRLRYAVEGRGTQILNLGLSPQEADFEADAEWTITVNGNVFLGQSEGWRISHDGTLTVSGPSGNVSVVHTDYFGNGSNLPFYEQHSVVIAIAAALAIVVVIAVGVKVVKRKQSSENQPIKANAIKKDEPLNRKLGEMQG